MTNLVLQPQLPHSFRLHSVPAGAEYDVIFTTPAEEKILGRFSPEKLNAALLLQLFPDWKPGGFLKMALGMMSIPPQFSMSARPEGDVIVFGLELNIPVGAPRTWTKRVPVQDWTLSQMAEVVSFLRDNKSSPKS